MPGRPVVAGLSVKQHAASNIHRLRTPQHLGVAGRHRAGALLHASLDDIDLAPAHIMPSAKSRHFASPARLAQLTQTTALADNMKPKAAQRLLDDPPKCQRVHCPTPIRRAMEPDTHFAAPVKISRGIAATKSGCSAL